VSPFIYLRSHFPFQKAGILTACYLYITVVLLTHYGKLTDSIIYFHDLGSFWASFQGLYK